MAHRIGRGTVYLPRSPIIQTYSCCDISIVLPSTTVSCVRSFCGLRRLKTLEVDNGVRPTKLGYFVYDSHAFDRQALMSSLSRGTLPASVMREENCMVVALLCEN